MAPSPAFTITRSMAVVELQENSVAWSPAELMMEIVTPSWLAEPEEGGGSNLVSWRKPWSAQDGLSDAGVGVPAAAYPYASTTAAAVRATVKSADRFFISNPLPALDNFVPSRGARRDFVPPASATTVVGQVRLRKALGTDQPNRIWAGVSHFLQAIPPVSERRTTGLEPGHTHPWQGNTARPGPSRLPGSSVSIAWAKRWRPEKWWRWKPSADYGFRLREDANYTSRPPGT